MPSRAHQLLTLGQSVWLDYIHRRELMNGVFEGQVRERGVVGVTSNPTIFQQAIAERDVYDTAIERGVAMKLEGEVLFEAIAVEDIQTACDILLETWKQTGGRDGRVSLEVSPKRAIDTAGTIEDARRLHRSVARPNVMIKVPATAAGLPAITELTADGISINVTLIFTLARHREVMDAYLTGLERRAGKGGTLEEIHSVASFFVSRVDSKVDQAIEQRVATLPEGSTERAELQGLLGKAAIANARLAWVQFRERFDSPQFATLRTRGANLQRPLWASTSTKNPAYPDTLYVDELIGPDTVNTMPPRTLEAYNDHGALEVRITRDLEAARKLFERLPKLGVPVETLIGELEGEGVAAFEKSYDALLETLEKERRELAGRLR